LRHQADDFVAPEQDGDRLSRAMWRSRIPFHQQVKKLKCSITV
jgi:hypothetical protein